MCIGREWNSMSRLCGYVSLASISVTNPSCIFSLKMWAVTVKAEKEIAFAGAAVDAGLKYQSIMPFYHPLPWLYTSD
jgi:hypothetical protein